MIVILDCLTLENGTDRLSRNVGTKLQFYAALNSKIVHLPYTCRRKVVLVAYDNWRNLLVQLITMTVFASAMVQLLFGTIFVPVLVRPISVTKFICGMVVGRSPEYILPGIVRMLSRRTDYVLVSCL